MRSLSRQSSIAISSVQYARRLINMKRVNRLAEACGLFCVLASLALFCGCACPRGSSRSFSFPGDSFAFRNELRWTYDFSDSGEVTTRQTEPPPEYSLRCFPMVRATREFFYHARFDP